ncbi:MAG TPA: nucleotidyltransferase [Nitrososphaera sp.]|nr:nucleotidyltransferase [Nitrososphaera sp.]
MALQLSEFNQLLSSLAQSLDIPDHLYEDATLKYEDIGEWLSADDSELKRFSPEVYPQGSFRLGTVVRPLSENDEYDIDLVCHLQISKENITQKELKASIGNRLRKRDDLAAILRPSRRCWTLDFSNQFHVDVLPAIPNLNQPPTGILLTDRELIQWQSSNPIKFAEWFYNRMTVIYNQHRAAIAESLKASIDEVPNWQVKTPLQQCIQLLKRHRDIHFENKPELRPVSIIITTLAALSYQNQADLSQALDDIVRAMPSFIENRNGRWWVANPVEPNENFADKWNEKPENREAFLAWLTKVQSDFTIAGANNLVVEAAETLSPVLGRRAMTKVADALGFKLLSSTLPTVIAPKTPSVPELGDTRHSQELQLPEHLEYKASIRGSVRLKKYSKKKLWELSHRPVPKKIWLRFEVVTNTPEPYAVKWQVVNTGKEATQASDLRGDFYDGNESRTVQWESTSYAGTHWIEAFIIRDGVCVARTGKKYVKVRG